MKLIIKTNNRALLTAYELSESLEGAYIPQAIQSLPFEISRMELELNKVPHFEETIEIVFDEELIENDNFNDIIQALAISLETE